MTAPNFEFDGAPILPDRDGYGLAMAFGATIANVAGGLSRSRSVSRNNSVNISAQYTLTLAQTRYVMDLYYNVLKEGQLPLMVRLEVTGSDLANEVWYEARIVGAPSFPTYLGHTNIIEFIFNVVPSIDKEVSRSRAATYEAFGGIPSEIDDVLDPLARFLPWP